MSYFTEKKDSFKTKDEIIEFLYGLLDDIDTIGDIAKGNDKLYRNMVEEVQKRKSETGIESDGYTLTIPELGN